VQCAVLQKSDVFRYVLEYYEFVLLGRLTYDLLGTYFVQVSVSIFG
jgi:hypothetical protein